MSQTEAWLGALQKLPQTHPGALEGSGKRHLSGVRPQPCLAHSYPQPSLPVNLIQLALRASPTTRTGCASHRVPKASWRATRRC